MVNDYNFKNFKTVITDHGFNFKLKIVVTIVSVMRQYDISVDIISKYEFF